MSDFPPRATDCVKRCRQCHKPIDRANGNYRKMVYCSLPCFHDSIRKPIEQAFVEKVDKGPHPKGCWHWTGSIKPRNGYGHLRSGQKDYNAHRVAYELANGPIPAGAHVLHSCDVPHCVNPDHLRIGTHQENMAECRDKGRSSAKLTPEQVREIRAAFAGVTGKVPNGFNQRLADKYGVKDKTIWEVRTGINWSHIK